MLQDKIRSIISIGIRHFIGKKSTMLNKKCTIFFKYQFFFLFLLYTNKNIIERRIKS